MNVLAAVAQWRTVLQLPEEKTIHQFLKRLPAQDTVIANTGNPAAPGLHTLRATYTRPYLSHGSIGPSCAVALYQADKLTVWTHSQGVYPLRDSLADMMRTCGPSRCTASTSRAPAATATTPPTTPPPTRRWSRAPSPDGRSACNGCASRSTAGSRSVRPWCPTSRPRSTATARSSPGITRCGATRIRRGPAGRPAICWRRSIWRSRSSRRRRRKSRCRKAAATATRFRFTRSPNAHVIDHFIPQMPLRVSALRTLGAYHNVVRDRELHGRAGRRRRRRIRWNSGSRICNDPRARDVITKAAQEFGWKKDDARPRGRGRGFAFARYKNLAAYCAVAVESTVEHESGEVRLGRVVAPSTADRRSIPTASATRSKARSCSRRAGPCMKR